MLILWPASLDLSQPLAEGPPTNGRNLESNTTNYKRKDEKVIWYIPDAGTTCHDAVESDHLAGGVCARLGC